MALNNIKMELKVDLRPCIVAGQKALFHRWESYSEIVTPSIALGGHNGGVISGTLGIIEREDGTIHKCYPEEVRFIDKRLSEYCWEEDI